MNEEFKDGRPVYRKDKTLDILAQTYNVAQFISFSPSSGSLKQEFSRVSGFSPNHKFANFRAAVEELLARSADKSVNIRSFAEGDFRSREFIYGLRTVEDAVSALSRIAAEGAFTILNETVDVSDGGVSGVAMGGVVEFRPDSTPRGVEKPGFAALPLEWAVNLFKTVYSTRVDLSASLSGRLEFSVHPRPQGWRQDHVLYWEYEETSATNRWADVSWPNDFSRALGDKVFGLLIANLAGANVPKTLVINRRIAPFSFGVDTGETEVWIRTSPAEQMPGLYTTARGWRDPFALLASEDPEGSNVASVLSQQGVKPLWSGAAIESTIDGLTIEGVEGAGDLFMLGRSMPQALPAEVMHSVSEVHRKLKGALGAVRFEWVFDGNETWIVQLHRGQTASGGSVIVPGTPQEWIDFRVRDGLEALRRMIGTMKPNSGIRFDARIGFTSHLADVVRKANVPAIVVASVEAKTRT